MSYRGGKAGSGVYQKIINLMPPHGTYIEAFLGAGAIMRTKRPAAFNVGVEIDAAVRRRQWSRCEIPNFELHTDAIKYLRDLVGELAVARERWPEFGDDILVYCDPPYLLSARSQQRSIYKCEFHSDEEHTGLIEILRELPCQVMLSGYASELYDRLLSDWRRVEFTGISRGGPTVEIVWLNFPEPAALHDYRFLGDDHRKRQDIKRQKERWLAKLSKMPSQRRYAMLAAIEEFNCSTTTAEMPTSAENGKAAVATPS